MDTLSPATWQVIRRMFPPGQHEAVAQLLAADCGCNLPFMENRNAVELERVRFAVLKSSNGDTDALLCAIVGAQSDWRDTLMAAGFAHDIEAHRRWATEYLTPGNNE